MFKKVESLAVDVVHVLLPRMDTAGVLLQPDLLVIGPCSAGLRHWTWRSVKDMNGLAEMERSQVTHVTLVFDTFKRALSPHQTCVAPVLSVHRRRVQHTLQEFGGAL